LTGRLSAWQSRLRSRGRACTAARAIVAVVSVGTRLLATVLHRAR
jgi:hypothetical protein